MSRRPISAYLSEEALEGFRVWAEHHDLDRTSLLEAFGLYLAANDPATWKRSQIGRTIVDTARPIHRDRRARPQK